MTESIAVQHYVPQEIATAKRWLPVVILATLASVLVDIARGSPLGAQLTMLICASMTLLWLVLPNREQKRQRDLSMMASGLSLIIALLHLISTPVRVIDLWISAWVVIPTSVLIWWLSSPPVSRWVEAPLPTTLAERGLERNQRLALRHEAGMTHILLLHACAIVLLPILWIIDVAVSPGNVLGGGFLDALSAEHFTKVLGGESFWLWLRNSLLVSIGTTLLGLMLAIPAAYAFSRYRFSGRKYAMFAFLLVQMFPGVIILVPYFLVMKSLGLLNSWLGLILAYSVTALPLCVWMLKGFFDTVPRELEEAALLDGCSQFAVFREVVLPLSLPAIAVTALFTFLAAWNEFLLALTFNTSNDMYTLPVGLASMISATGQAWGDFAAASLLVSLPVIILFIVFQKFLIEGLSAGGVKG